jgi:hypothetical protein
MDESDGKDMVQRLVWLTGLGAVLLSLARLGRLLQPQTEGPAWHVVLLAAVVLGGVFTWVARSYRLSALIVVAVNAVGLALAVLRITAPASLVAGVIPTAETLDTLRGEMGFAWEILRFGAAPVLPVAGLVALLAIVYWSIGALGAAGILSMRPGLVTVPAIAFYLQLATLDRRSPGLGWLAAFAAIAALTVVAMANPGDPAAGRLRARTGMLIPRVSMAAALLVGVGGAIGAVAMADTFASAVPEAGTLQWRTQTGIGSGLYGGSSFNLFVGMQQSLVSLSDDPLFYATVSDSAPQNEELYWKLITLDTYDGEYWIPGSQSWAKQGGTRWEREDLAFQGPTVPVAARIQIAGLRESILRTPCAATRISSGKAAGCERTGRSASTCARTPGGNTRSKPTCRCPTSTTWRPPEAYCHRSSPKPLRRAPSAARRGVPCSWTGPRASRTISNSRRTPPRK